MQHVCDEPLVARMLLQCTFADEASSFTCAVSGGPDSSALLVLAAAGGRPVTAIHVDHGLRDSSSNEAGIVAALAARFGAAFVSEQVAVEPGPNLEARCRDARAAVLPPATLTGHTADDQAETVLINLLRGAGLSGVTGLDPVRHPLLALRRADTEALCEHLQIEPVRDPMNDDPSFLRNRIRHEVLPLLRDVAGRDVVPLFARHAEVVSADDALLDAQASCIDPTDGDALARAAAPLARRAVRRWLRSAHSERQPPSLDAVERVLAVARLEARATEVPGGIRVTRHERRLSVTVADSRLPTDG